MKKYDKEPFEFLNDEQLEKLLEVTNQEMTKQNKINIKNKVHESIKEDKHIVNLSTPLKKKRTWQYILGAVATLSLIVGFTQFDNIKSAYLKNFGTESEKLLLDADELNESVTDQGLKLTTKSSFKDGNSTYLFMTLQDLTGDRLSQDTQIDSWNMLNGGNTSVVAYDEKTKTATLMTSAISFEDNNGYGYELKRFKSNAINDSFLKEIDWDNLLQDNPNWEKKSLLEGSAGGYNEEVLKELNITFEDLDKMYLEPGVLNTSLDDSNQIIIENMAYKDNLLHVLVKHPNDLNTDGLFLSLSSKTTQQLVDSVASFQAVGKTHNNETGRSDYEEFVFNIPKNKLNDYEFKVESFSYNNVIEGSWPIKLKKPIEIDSKQLSSVALSNDITLNNIVLSGISISFDYEIKSQKNVPLTLEVIKKDGQKKEIQTNDIELSREYESNPIKIVYDYIPLDEIKAIVINGQSINIDQ